MEVEEKKYWASGVHFHNRESLVDPDWNAEREREHISRTVALIGGEQIWTERTQFEFDSCSSSYDNNNTEKIIFDAVSKFIPCYKFCDLF